MLKGFFGVLGWADGFLKFSEVGGFFGRLRRADCFLGFLEVSWTGRQARDVGDDDCDVRLLGEGCSG